MSERKSWMDERPELVVERLVSAARIERPSSESLTRALAGVGVATAATSAATTAGASGASAAVAVKATSFAAGGFFKWTLLAVTVAGSAGLAVETVRQRSATPVVAAARASSSVREASPPVAPAVAVAPLEPAVPAPSAPQPVAKPARSVPAVRAEPSAESPLAIDAERLAEEVRSIDAARVRVSSGRAAEALALLDQYERTFEKPGFAPEALYLRMEALLELGQNAAARSSAARLVRAYPQSPQAPRARQVLAEQNP
jgi:hypothetical protein